MLGIRFGAKPVRPTAEAVMGRPNTFIEQGRTQTMNKRLRKRGLSVISLLVMLVALLAAGGGTASAAQGDNLRVISGAYSQSCNINTGIAFDGTNLLITCWQHNVIDVVSPVDGSLVTTVTVPGYYGLMAVAWDAGRNKLWACAEHDKVLLVDTSNGSSTLMFSGNFCTDGLAYDGSDDTLWVSADVAGTVYHLQTDGTVISANAVTGLTGNCGNSGIAVGGTTLYLANNGCSEIYGVLKDFSSSTLFASFPARLEDLECDDVTFAAQGVGAIWSIDAYDRAINAWEIPAGLCGFGGGGEPIRGRMTGGGSVFAPDGTRVTHGFTLDCDATDVVNSLQVNWGGHRFHLDSMDSALCQDSVDIGPEPPVAGFDTHIGRGTGSYDGVSGATAEWTFTDAGEPGQNDTVTITIKDAGSNVVLAITKPANLRNGNHQAHRD
jgi:3D (Asp-Asp-Asp) domain-containing protein